MADAIWKEYELFCQVCNAHFKQLVVLHKVPENFDIAPYLAGFVESHDHKAWQEAQREKAPKTRRGPNSTRRNPDHHPPGWLPTRRRPHLVLCARDEGFAR